jgi:hypothetical protein
VIAGIKFDSSSSPEAIAAIAFHEGSLLTKRSDKNEK